VKSTISPPPESPDKYVLVDAVALHEAVLWQRGGAPNRLHVAPAPAHATAGRFARLFSAHPYSALSAATARLTGTDNFAYHLTANETGADADVLKGTVMKTTKRRHHDDA